MDEEEEAEIAMLRWSDDEFEYDDAMYENQGEIGLLSLEGGGSGGGRGNLSFGGRGGGGGGSGGGGGGGGGGGFSYSSRRSVESAGSWSGM